MGKVTIKQYRCVKCKRLLAKAEITEVSMISRIIDFKLIYEAKGLVCEKNKDGQIRMTCTKEGCGTVNLLAHGELVVV